MKTCPVCDTDYPDQHTNCATDGAVLIVSQELASGSLVRGKYRIVRKIGQGGMGVVYLAEDSLLGVKVALKFLASDLGKDPRFIKRFRTEARAAYQLRHPNIAEVTNLDQAEDGSLFIAMEYIEGPSLRAVLDQNPKGLAILRALEIAKGIVSGLAAAHAQGTIHRDIKPENILLTKSADGTERVKVLDFGIAAVAESVTRMTRTQGFILTYAYAAPEQWNEMPADQMDGRTDLYALGCVLYEMLTGTTPFHAQTTAGWMKQHLDESPKPPSTLRPEIAEWANLDALLAILLAKDCNQRPKDAAELITLLGAVKHLPSPKELNTIVERQQTVAVTIRQTVVEAARADPNAVGWHVGNHLKRRWKLYTAMIVVIGAFLLLVAVPRLLLPSLLVNACEQGDSQLAYRIAETFEKLGPLGAEFLAPYARDCASGRDGWSCLKVAGSHYVNGGQVLTGQLEKTLTARGVDLMAKHCFQGDGGQYSECDELGNAYRHHFDSYYMGSGLSLRPKIHLSVPYDPQKAMDALIRGCDLDSAAACADMGDAYHFGLDVTADPAKARLFYSKACDVRPYSDFVCSKMGGEIEEVDPHNLLPNWTPANK